MFNFFGANHIGLHLLVKIRKKYTSEHIEACVLKGNNSKNHYYKNLNIFTVFKVVMQNTFPD